MASRVMGVVAALLLLVAGCRTGTVKEPLTGTLAGNDPETQMAFLHQLAERPLVSNDEAFHALLLFTDGRDPADSYEGRVALMKQRGLLGAGFNGARDAAVSRGDLAVVIVNVFEIRGGLNQLIFGRHNPRYAYRELEYEGVYPQGSPNQTFTGAQFMGLMQTLEDYERLRARPLQVQPDEVKSQPEFQFAPPGVQSPEAVHDPATQPVLPPEGGIEATQPVTPLVPPGTETRDAPQPAVPEPTPGNPSN